MLEKKRTEKDRFSGLKSLTSRGIDQPAQLAREPVDWLPLSGPIEVRSKIMITCQALNAQMASKPVDPLLDPLRLIFDFLGSRG